MKTFTDSSGRTWTIAVTVDAIKRVEGLIKGVNLANLTSGDPPLLTRLETDVVLLCDVIFALVKPQADAMRHDEHSTSSKSSSVWRIKAPTLICSGGLASRIPPWRPRTLSR